LDPAPNILSRCRHLAELRRRQTVLIQSVRLVVWEANSEAKSFSVARRKRLPQNDLTRGSYTLRHTMLSESCWRLLHSAICLIRRCSDCLFRACFRYSSALCSPPSARTSRGRRCSNGILCNGRRYHPRL